MGKTIQVPPSAHHEGLCAPISHGVSEAAGSECPCVRLEQLAPEYYLSYMGNAIRS